MTDPTRGPGTPPGASRELHGVRPPDAAIARVLAAHGARWLVAVPGEAPRLVAARARLRDAPETRPVTGDWVALDAAGAIAGVFAREGVVIRRRAGRATQAQVLAANVDIALVAEPLPAPNVRRIERFIALAAAGGVRPLVVLSKADRATGPGAGDTVRRAGAEVLPVSAHTGEGLDRLARAVRGNTSVLLGPSGAGKSTLLNALVGAERARTGAVRAVDDRGRHTTVTRELVPLPGGGALIDTPGLREVGVWDDAGAGFGDIEELAARCRFRDCAHETEPGCAVRDAVDPARLDAWRTLRREGAWIEDRRAAARAREARGREWARARRRQR
ncbi:MAG TPA: ribosome small subunit-dependent GTPase A [Miltoncostaeaceae bacterium]|nr:ribosome small subunit-dependent GTPase A [Miltoncostaeaceae bacterium]